MPKRSRPTEQERHLPSEPGTYVLAYHCPATFSTKVGALGKIQIIPGFWLYVGSALGSGGLAARVSRHCHPVRSGERRHWHIDYVKNRLLPVAAWLSTGCDRLEHEWATSLARIGVGVPGFGSSDCGCSSHFLRTEPSELWCLGDQLQATHYELS